MKLTILQISVIEAEQRRDFELFLKQQRAKLMPAEPKPVKCKEWWLSKKGNGRIALWDTKHGAVVTSLDSDSIIRVIEPLSEESYRSALREKVMQLDSAVTRLFVNEIVLISKELGMVEEEQS